MRNDFYGSRRGKTVLGHEDSDIPEQSTDVAYFDFSKAFDAVSHVKLFKKLKAAGLTGNLLK